MEMTQTPIYQTENGSLPNNIKVEKLLIEWTAPSRPYKRRTREFYTTVGSIAFLIGVILLLLKEFLLIGVIVSFAFLSYVLASHEPDQVSHQITTYGIRTDNKLHEWDTLSSFWIKKEWDQELLICRTKSSFPVIILLVLDPNKKADILKEVGDKIQMIKPVDTFVDKASQWLSDKIPLENKS